MGNHATALAIRKSMHARITPDLAPFFELLRNYGITQLDGLIDISQKIRLRYKKLPEDAVAQVNAFGSVELAVPFDWRGKRTPDGNAHYLSLGEREISRRMHLSTLIHELAHAEYRYYKRHPKKRSGRTERQHRLMQRLNQHLWDKGSIWYWRDMQTNEVAAYFMAASFLKIVEYLQNIFLVNKLRAKSIQSIEERESLRTSDGGERLLYFNRSNVRRDITKNPPWLAAGQDGDAFFMAKPIEVGIPKAWRIEFYRDILGLGMPETPEQFLNLAQNLKGPWAEKFFQKIREARDKRASELKKEAETSQVPSTSGLTSTSSPQLPAPSTEATHSLGPQCKPDSSRSHPCAVSPKPGKPPQVEPLK
jgi:hypothetical protein